MSTFETIALLLPWQSPVVNASFPMLVHVFTVLLLPFLSFISHQNHMSIVNLLLGFGLNFVCKETTEIHGNLNWSPQQ